MNAPYLDQPGINDLTVVVMKLGARVGTEKPRGSVWDDEATASYAAEGMKMLLLHMQQRE